MTQSLSITTFRYVPPDLRSQLGSESGRELSQRLNQDAADGGGEERRSVSVQRARRRQVRAARLHRELPHRRWATSRRCRRWCPVWEGRSTPPSGKRRARKSGTPDRARTPSFRSGRPPPRSARTGAARTGRSRRGRRSRTSCREVRRGVARLQPRAEPRGRQPLEPGADPERELRLAIEIGRAEERRAHAGREERPERATLAAELVDEAPLHLVDVDVEQLGAALRRRDLEVAALASPGGLDAEARREEEGRARAPGEAARELEVLDAQRLLLDPARGRVAAEEADLESLRKTRARPRGR